MPTACRISTVPRHRDPYNRPCHTSGIACHRLSGRHRCPQMFHVEQEVGFALSFLCRWTFLRFVEAWCICIRVGLLGIVVLRGTMAVNCALGHGFQTVKRWRLWFGVAPSGGDAIPPEGATPNLPRADRRNRDLEIAGMGHYLSNTCRINRTDNVLAEAEITTCLNVGRRRCGQVRNHSAEHVCNTLQIKKIPHVVDGEQVIGNRLEERLLQDWHSGVLKILKLDFT